MHINKKIIHISKNTMKKDCFKDKIKISEAQYSSYVTVNSASNFEYTVSEEDTYILPRFAIYIINVRMK